MHWKDVQVSKSVEVCAITVHRCNLTLHLALFFGINKNQNHLAFIKIKPWERLQLSKYGSVDHDDGDDGDDGDDDDDEFFWAVFQCLDL